jgi:hypothetical protein
MLVQVTVTEEKQVTKEIELPFCVKDGKTFYRINPDKTILVLHNYSTFKTITLNMVESFGYDHLIKKIVEEYIPCDESEVLAAAEEINEVMAKRSTELVAV